MATVVISDKFGGLGTACDGSWDAMHTFNTRKSGGNFGKNKAGEKLDGGGKMDSKIGAALKSFYKDNNLNPCVTSIKITVIPETWTIEYEATIEESPDGNAYVGFRSWGGMSAGYPKKTPPSGHAYSNYLTAKKEWTPAGATIKDVIDFHFPGGFRQIFFQFTDPSFPNKPKSANAKTGTVGVQIGPSGSPKNLPEYNGIVVNTTSVTPGGSTVGATVDTNVASTTQSTASVAQGTVDGTSTTNTGASFDFVTLKECFMSVPPRKGGSVPVFIYYPKSEAFETEFEINNSKFTFTLDKEQILGTHSGIKMASRIVGFDNNFFKLNGNSLDKQILEQKESPVKDWFKKYVNVFVNHPFADFNTILTEVTEDLETRSLSPSSLNLFMYGESTSPDTPVMKEITNLTGKIKTLTLLEPLPSQDLVGIASKIKTAGGRVYYTYNPNLFNIDLTDINMISGTVTYSFKNDNIGQSSIMFPKDPITGFTPSLVSNPIVVNSGLTTSFWQLDLPVSINKVGTSSFQLNYGGNIITKSILATGPTGADVNLVPFLPGGSFSGYSPRGLIYSNGELIHKGPQLPTGSSASTNLSLFRSFFGTISYEDKDWIFSSTGTSSGTGSSVSTLSQNLGVTFSFSHKGLKDNLLSFSYTKLSDDLIKSGAYVYDLSKDAEYNRNRAGGTASGWPDLVQQPLTLIITTGSSGSGQTPSGTPTQSLTASYTIRYLNLQNYQPVLNIEKTPELALQIFSYDIESVVGKSAKGALTPKVIPKIRGKFIFDVSFKGLFVNDQLGEFKILNKIEIDPFVFTEEDDLSGLLPEFLEEAFQGEGEVIHTPEELVELDADMEEAETILKEQGVDTTPVKVENSTGPVNFSSTGLAPATPGYDVQGKSTIPSSFNKSPHYCQGDSRWGKLTYSKPDQKCLEKGGGESTIKSSGCGPTSLTMAINYWAGQGYCSPTNPAEVCDLVKNNGGRVCKSGSSLNDTVRKALEQKFGLTFKSGIGSSGLMPYLKKGWPCIMSGGKYGQGTAGPVLNHLGGPKTSTTAGHFVCLTGIDSQGRIRVSDPGYGPANAVTAFNPNTEPAANVATFKQSIVVYPLKLA